LKDRARHREAEYGKKVIVRDMEGSNGGREGRPDH